MKKVFVILFILSGALLGLNSLPEKQSLAPLPKLSDYGLFSGKLSDLHPVTGVIPYELNTPLFSDYAHKSRFIKIPEGSSALYSASEVFDFPAGTIIAKSFLYPLDAEKPSKGRRIIETRILMNTENGWVAYPYIWNLEQTEAFYDPAGKIEQIERIDATGKKIRHEYVVPNKNQCKACHEKSGKIVPIGPSARQLNRMHVYAEGSFNQIEYLKMKGLLLNAPAADSCPKLPVWNDSRTGTLDERARAYLDANCGHCHRPEGQASTSGLVLLWGEKNPTLLGVNKTPVAAGRAAANMRFSIDAGHPEKSIMIYRMESLDPGIMMPETGRRLVDKEGLALLKEWIQEMKPSEQK
jgi:uncharacterized repeat protein (TIGR03806 family)